MSAEQNEKRNPEPFEDPKRSDRLDREEPRAKPPATPDQRREPDDEKAGNRAVEQSKKQPRKGGGK